MYDPEPWKVRRSHADDRKYQVCLFERVTVFDARIKDIIPGEFDTVESAQEFANCMNTMRREVRNVERI